MKRTPKCLLMMLIAWVLYPATGYAQQVIDKETFEKLVDYVNCELTDAYLDNVVSRVNEKEKENYNSIRKNLKTNDINNPVAFKELEGLLKKSNNLSTLEKLSQVVEKRKAKFQASATNKDLIFTILDNSDVNETLKGHLKARAAELRQTLESKYSPQAKPADIKAASDDDMVLQRLENIDNSKNNNTGAGTGINLWMVLIVLLVTAISGFILFRISSRQINKLRLELEIINRGLDAQKNESQNHKQSINRLRENMNILTDHVNETNLKPTGRNVVLSNQETTTVKRNDNHAEEFFMSTPNMEGSFSENSISITFKPSASYYRFVIDSPNSSRARFYFVDDEKAVRTALTYPDDYIDKVCTADNNINFSAKRILTTRPGIAEHKGDKWILIQKAHIKYE